MAIFRNFLLLIVVLFVACHTPKVVTTSTDDHLIEFQFLQINDVYEITPLEGGRSGGMARVASLRKKLLTQNENLLTVHAGDFLNPSLIGTIKYEGSRVKGRQMIEVMNASGIDLVTFGNHEFDLKEEELQQRLNESTFDWVSSNTLQVNGSEKSPFYKEVNGRKHPVSDTWIWDISDADGTAVKVGLFGVTLPVNKTDYVHYNDFYAEAKRAAAELQKTTNIVVGLTHLEIEQDKELARQLSNVPLLMGGHDHHNMKHTIGQTTITKADANVRSAYIHTLRHNTETGKTDLTSELVKITDALPNDPATQKVVDKWNDILLEQVGQVAPNPEQGDLRHRHAPRRPRKPHAYPADQPGRHHHQSLFSGGKTSQPTEPL